MICFSAKRLASAVTAAILIVHQVESLVHQHWSPSVASKADTKVVALTWRQRKHSRSVARIGGDVQSVDDDNAGDEPFAIVRDDLKAMKDRIRALVERTLEGESQTESQKSMDTAKRTPSSQLAQSHPLLQEAAREFFERRERAFRPAVVILVARALPFVAEESEASTAAARQCLLAEIVEMMSTAHIIHDSVLEDGDDSALGNVAHRVYSSSAGNKVSVLAGDFLLARCSVALSQLGDLRVVERMAAALEDMVHGNVLRHEVSDRDSYNEAIRLKTSSLIANACLSAAILGGHEPESTLCQAVYAYAEELGLAYQTVADVILYEEKAHSTNTPPILSALPPAVFADEPQAAIQAALEAANDHAHKAVASLEALPPSPEKLALLKMARYVSERDQRGLQREKYVASMQTAAAATM